MGNHYLSLLEKAGSVRLDKFLNECLYHSEHGYYSKASSQIKDYVTAPQLSYLFSAFVANFLTNKAKSAGVKEACFVDLGGGTGELAAAIVSTVRKSIFNNSSVYFLETSKPRTEKALELEPHILPIKDVSLLPDNIPVFAVANEFFDSFMPRVFRIEKGVLVEAYVTLKEKRASLTFKPVNIQSDLKSELEFLSRHLPPGAIIEIQESLRNFIKSLSSFKHIYLLVFDYGYFAGDLERFPEGSLVAYKDQTMYQDYLSEPGTRDITCHVNFSLLTKWLSESGFIIQRVSSQGAWLVENGLVEFFENLTMKSDEPSKTKKLGELKKIVLPGIMGEIFSIIEATKGM